MMKERKFLMEDKNFEKLKDKIKELGLYKNQKNFLSPFMEKLSNETFIFLSRLPPGLIYNIEIRKVEEVSNDKQI